MRKWLDDLLRQMKHGGPWAKAVKRAEEALQTIRGELDAIASATHQLQKRLTDVELKIGKLEDELELAQRRIGEALEDGAENVAELRRKAEELQQSIQALEEKRRRMQRRAEGLEETQQNTAARHLEARQRLDDAELHIGNPDDY